jgi:hypothetical protein
MLCDAGVKPDLHATRGRAGEQLVDPRETEIFVARQQRRYHGLAAQGHKTVDKDGIQCMRFAAGQHAGTRKAHNG